jgi:hypothetical protein
METCDLISLTQREEESAKPEVEDSSEFNPKTSTRNWSKKKIQEVLHLSRFVGRNSKEFHCDLVLDIGSGLVRQIL